MGGGLHRCSRRAKAPRQRLGGKPAGQRDILAFPHTAGREREILEHAVHTIAEQAAKADDLVDEAIEVGTAGQIRSSSTPRCSGSSSCR
jgi:hypothetical protein